MALPLRSQPNPQQSQTATDSVTLSYQPLGPVNEPSTGESGLDADD